MGEDLCTRRLDAYGLDTRRPPPWQSASDGRPGVAPGGEAVLLPHLSAGRLPALHLGVTPRGPSEWPLGAHLLPRSRVPTMLFGT
jgi:hypothetical protein